MADYPPAHPATAAVRPVNLRHTKPGVVRSTAPQLMAARLRQPDQKLNLARPMLQPGTPRRQP